ncbi:MAG: hypothetical protein D6826_03615 [Alphaproteobacteria bacterium]|nr:MAG: hypothetical protein D6826_03615 [Alphaproteobacteria bacterium]
MVERAIIVHCLADARAAAAAAAALGCPVTLSTAPGAATYLGPAWLSTLIARVAEEYPHVAITGLVDCGDRPGYVLAALRQGARRIRFTGRPKVARSLAAAAESCGATLVTGHIETLDLAEHDNDRQSACRRWLAAVQRRKSKGGRTRTR